MVPTFRNLKFAPLTRVTWQHRTRTGFETLTGETLGAFTRDGRTFYEIMGHGLIEENRLTACPK